ERLKIAIEQRAKDRFFVGKVVIDVPFRQFGFFRDVIDARGPVATMRKQLQRGIENLFAAALRVFPLIHDAAPTSARSFTFSTFPYADRGSASRKTNCFGSLYLAMRCARNAVRSSADTPCPTSNAIPASPHFSSAIGTTAASVTAGWSRSSP